jgi:predicted nucleic-acid-binding Zn-ribbon protein
VNGGSGDVFCGRVLNQPEQLTSSAQGSQIHFIVPQNGKYPLSVTEKYLAQRSEWTIHPCNRCGMSELFDPPSELIRIVFPNLPEGTSLETFTAFCGACGGVQAVEKKIYQLPGQTTDKTIAKRKWWKFWA